MCVFFCICTNQIWSLRMFKLTYSSCDILPPTKSWTCQHLQATHDVGGTQNAMMNVSWCFHFWRGLVTTKNWILPIDYHKSTKCRSYIYIYIYNKKSLYWFVYDFRKKNSLFLTSCWSKGPWTIDTKPWYSLCPACPSTGITWQPSKMSCYSGCCLNSQGPLCFADIRRKTNLKCH